MLSFHLMCKRQGLFSVDKPIRGDSLVEQPGLSPSSHNPCSWVGAAVDKLDETVSGVRYDCSISHDQASSQRVLKIES
jgi:hypothetical protein